jgi:hypothetical protein
MLAPALVTAAATAATAQTPPPPAGAVVEPPSKADVGGLQVENAFVSSTGWVKPGESYPSRLVLTNPGEAAVSGVTVTLADRRGMSWTDARSDVGAAAVDGGSVTWTVPSVPAGAVVALVLEAKADTLEQEPTIVWRDISSIADVKVGSAAPTQVASHGPKVIPPTGGYETARYGDRPFPVVPVDYFDSKHQADHPADMIDSVINDPANPSSTYNLFQEMSFGQLYPNGTIGSLDAKGAAVTPEDELVFTRIEPESATPARADDGQPDRRALAAHSEGQRRRLVPAARPGAATTARTPTVRPVVGSLGGVAPAGDRLGLRPDGQGGVRRAGRRDPDIDYNDFDTDKDGVVDFFEVIFEGCGGNGRASCRSRRLPAP